MNYRFLSEQLRPIAEGARKFFQQKWGAAAFKAEEAIDSEITFRPTLQAQTADHHLLCIEVSANPYPGSLEPFVADCVRLSKPVRMFVAVPDEPKSTTYNSDIERAKKFGVGVLEVRKATAKIIHNALPLSLAGARPIPIERFPRKYRLALSEAETTFRSGQPSKGCSLVYDEIEDVSRSLAKKTFEQGLWNAGAGGGLRFETDAWHRVVKSMMDNLDYKRCPAIKVAMLARTLGITSHRNDASHKPTSVRLLTKRDTQLRTRFENAIDHFEELVAAAKSSGIRP